MTTWYQLGSETDLIYYYYYGGGIKPQVHL